MVAALLCAGLTGCTPPAEGGTASPGATAHPSTSPTPEQAEAETGVGGLDIRYLDADGRVKKLDVKDFPR